jgi:DNA modification methylase
LVALQTLLDEKDPTTRDWRYRGKVDLVYIDPPFMVNNDFRADNTIDIDLGGDEEVQVKKEPSLVEVLAYKDTWRQGLDSFLTMLRRRLELLKELLAPTGSIYVHLDWHAVHYVKVLMDEVFGYENFVNEIVWKRTTAHSDTKGFSHVQDTVLAYAASTGAYVSTLFGPHSAELVRSHYNQIDPATGNRFTLDNLTRPSGSRPNLMYTWKGHEPPATGWRYAKEVMEKTGCAGPHRLSAERWPSKIQAVPQRRGNATHVDMDGSPSGELAGERGARLPNSETRRASRRIISASSPPSGLVLDCFLGSGTTAEAAERLGRRWIGVDNGKYAIHLARKRLIQLHGQPRPVEKPQYDYVECDKCKNIDHRAEKPRHLQRAPLHRRKHGRVPAGRRMAGLPDQAIDLPRRDDQGLRRRAGGTLAASARQEGKFLDSRGSARWPRVLGPGVEHCPRGATHDLQGGDDPFRRLRHPVRQREIGHQ